VDVEYEDCDDEAKDEDDEIEYVDDEDAPITELTAHTLVNNAQLPCTTVLLLGHTTLRPLRPASMANTGAILKKNI
jgi:hypothetical protein